MVISLVLPRKFAIRTWFCNCPQYLCFLAFSLSAAQENTIQERCWFSQIDFFVKYFPHRIKILFLSKCLYWVRTGRPDILWSVNKLARSIKKWTKAFDKRLNRLISYIHHTCEYKQYCHVGDTAKQCRL